MALSDDAFHDPLGLGVETSDHERRVVANDGTYVDSDLSAMLASERAAARLSPLTKREQEILGHLADGMTNDRVASALGISAETVQSHVRHAMVKLAADSRTEAVATALRHSLIT